MPQKTSWEYFPLPCQQNCFVTPQSFLWHQKFLKKWQYLQESCFKHTLFGKGKALWSLCDNFEKLSDYFWTSNHHCLTHFQDKETCSSWEPSVVSRVNWTLTNVHKMKYLLCIYRINLSHFATDFILWTFRRTWIWPMVNTAGHAGQRRPTPANTSGHQQTPEDSSRLQRAENLISFSLWVQNNIFQTI